MWAIGPVGFTLPWLLLGLLALPLLWLLLRAIPPAPVRRRFPGVALLLGLADETAVVDRTPPWLLILRMLAVAAVILGFAGPVLNPAPQGGGAGGGPLLILTDGSWASARDWPAREAKIDRLLTEAERAGRKVAVVSLTDPPQGALPFQSAQAWLRRLSGIRPQPWAPQPQAVADWAKRLDGRFATYWLSDGLARPERAPLLAALERHGSVRVFQTATPVLALKPVDFRQGTLKVAVLRPAGGPARQVTVLAHGPDPTGAERELAHATAAFAAGATSAEAVFTLPTELRNRVNRFEIGGLRSAGAVSLADDSLKRRKVALIAGVRDREGLQLLSPTHYLKEALDPEAEVIEGKFQDLMQAAPDVVILSDVARMAPAEQAALEAWVKKGGMLLRFAGPRMAESDLSRQVEDPLMPVRLRAGGREVGGAMSWGQPKKLQPFPKTSPFYGLSVPADVTVNEQVLAEPDPTLADRTIASLADGTPLVTRKSLGQGQVVLFHVTANAEWSSLPLSGLFVQMLDRLAVANRSGPPTAKDLEGTTWVARRLIDGFGASRNIGETAGIAGSALAAALIGAGGQPGPAVPPGIYAAQDRHVTLNVLRADSTLSPAVWPARIAVEGAEAPQERALKGPLLAFGLLLLLADIFAALVLTQRLRGTGGGSGGGPNGDGARGPGRGTAGAAAPAAKTAAKTAAVLLALLLALPGQGRAAPGDDAFALQATHGVVLAHVVTGDATVDRTAQAGLLGLSQALTARSSVEPDTPMAVNIETDDLSLFPFLYWPVTADEPLPSANAYAKLNDFLRTGGMILFDTRDGDIAGTGGVTTPEGARLQQIAAGLDIPPLQIVPKDHVLTRSFYLIQDFPGRYDSRNVWVEAAPPGAEKAEGMPFRNLNDGVSPVVIGGNDWAAAWAVDASGAPLFPVGRGAGGERQREIAYRFGINLIMYVLTGNYKSDQVHVPALLQRLGQ